MFVNSTNEQGFLCVYIFTQLNLLHSSSSSNIDSLEWRFPTEIVQMHFALLCTHFCTTLLHICL